MSEINASSIEDVRLGTQLVSALMVGKRELFVRFSKTTYSTPGKYSMTLPDWVTGYAVIMSGGGGGGRAGNGTVGTNGNGGNGGGIQAFFGTMETDTDKVMKITIGAGGAGGSEGNTFGKAGGDTTVTNPKSNLFTAAGGVGNPTSGGRDGGVTTTTFSDTFSKYVNLVPGTTYTNGPGGTSKTDSSGKRGGGGWGGSGGLFGSYTKGGKGGDGFVEIYSWGFPRDQVGVVRITLGTHLEARNQFRSALEDRGLDYQTVEYLPFDIDLVGAGSARELFQGCSSLKSVPNMDTTGVTDMRGMFYGCSSLTDGNVRLIGRNSKVKTTNMIDNSGLTRPPFYDSAGNPI